MYRTIMAKGRSILQYKGVSIQWWVEAVSTAVYLIHGSNNSVNSFVTPFELDSNMKLRIKHLRVFGSQGYGNIDDAKRTKLEPRVSYLCFFSGTQRTPRGV